ncbi:MAG: TonB-dependent receptor [Flavobacteriales bacterium]|nr:TonB-dependent receptor [Flavobacteriales bacterium]
MNKLLFIILFIFSINTTFSQGTIQGNAKEKETGEVLIGATVMMQGLKTSSGGIVGTIIDFDGNYTIKNVAVGSHKLICSYISFRSDTIDIIVLNGKSTTQNFSLSTSAMAIETFTVEAKADRKNEEYLLQVKKKSATVMEVIGAKEIAKRGDGNAAAAAKRITGLTIESGKYIYVRGLSDRYSKTTINKAEIPGLDPNRNAVQLDLFPTNMIENMKVIKSFTPDLPGSFTGGLIDIETKDFPEAFIFQFGTSLGYNTASSLKDGFLTYKGGGTDYLGLDDGARNQPASTGQIPALFVNNNRLENVSKSFNKEMDVSEKKSFLNQSYSLSVGNQTKLFGKNLGFVAGLSYSKKYNHRDEEAFTNRYNLTGKVSEVNELNPDRTLKDIQSEENVLWGVIANLSYKIAPNHKLGFVYLRNQNGITTTSFQEGELPKDQPGLFLQTRALEYEQNSLSSYQTKGEHFFEGLKKLKIDWMYAYSQSNQNQPDLRYFSNDYTINEITGDTSYSIQASIYPVPTRYYRELNQTTTDAKINFEFNIKEKEGKSSKIKFGGALLQQERILTENRYNYRSQGFLTYNGNVSGYLNDNNFVLPSVGNPVSDYIYIEDATEKRNSYSADQSVFAGYLMGDIWATKKLRIVTGARLETTDIFVRSFDQDEKTGSLTETDILPTLNASYALTKNSNLRAALSRTLARPTFREIAPFATYDFSTNWIIVGNPNLERTLVNNFDLRYEVFPNFGEIISIGGFYKSFTNPIELVFNTQAQNEELTWRNIESATVYGAEFEIKKKLNFISNEENMFNVGGNFTYVFSEVGIDEQELELIKASDPNAKETRSLFGQSPYIINLYLGYNNDSLGFSANLSYNVSGEKIAVVIIGGTPNVYQQPTQQLDFNINKKLGKHFSLKFKAQNILNPLFKKTYNYKGEEYIFNSYKKGVTFSIGLKYLIG